MTLELTRPRPSRPGFTLTEMMVAMALSLGIMLILTESFKMALDFTSHSGATGRLMYQLDNIETILRRDLEADHFLPGGDATSGPKLIDQRLDRLTKTGTGWTPPRGGFFRIHSPTPQFICNDRDGFAVTTATNHLLHFTSILPGTSDDELFTATVGGGIYRSRAAEIAYFLVPMPDNARTAQDPAGLPLFNLIRRQRLVAVTDDDRAALQPAAGDVEVVAATAGNIETLASIRDLSHRLPVIPGVSGPLPAGSPTPINPGVGGAVSAGPRLGDDIVASNVLSFEVLVSWDKNTTTGVNAFPRGHQEPNDTAAPFNTAYPFAHLWQGLTSASTAPFVFDTHANPITALSQAIRVRALQVTVRLFDPSSKQSRQNTWVFVP